MECHNCGQEFSRIALHWSTSNCTYPNISDKQNEVLTGLMMGDGWAEDKDNGKARVRVAMINKQYISYLNSLFPIYGTGVSQVTKDGFNGPTDMYQFSTMTAPAFSQYRNWYDEGTKSISDIQLTPTVAKHWYASDGSTEFDGGWSRAKLYCDVGLADKGAVIQMFEESGSPVPKWEEYKRENGNPKGVLVFSSKQTDDFLNWIGDPLPGFKYKWGESLK